MNTNFRNVDEYISLYSPEIQEVLLKIRAIIKTLAPNVEESINYGMPAYKLHGKPLVYFAANKAHIGFYATPSGHTAFANELSVYKQGKGSVQFPYKQEIPFSLIEKIVLFRIEENNNKAK